MNDIAHDYDNVERAAAEFDKLHAKLSAKKHKVNNGHAKASSTGRGDGLGEVVAKAASTALQSIEKALDSLADHADKASKGLLKMNKNHRENEERLGQEFQRIVAKHDTTPVYLLSADGRIQRLHSDGSAPKPITGHEAGIRDLLSPDPNGPGNLTTVGPPNDRTKFPFTPKRRPKEGRPQVPSTKIDPGSSELARATQRARRATNQYGGGVLENPSANYAAFHYDNGTGNPVIVVAQSIPRSSHSEIVLGLPFLRKGLQDNVDAVYTERQPCPTGSTCGAWLKQYFPKTTDVTHSFDYNGQASSDGNVQHNRYLINLKRRHQQIYG
ncbi:nucleic acid/nucleotide deaminase domain-containing protein [Kitasatospora sp. NPDC059795]|uniref:nucleic acid/nucleotide deaminase domain-containing protein n=1 Tax=Kitasatospora sp. NPDC059795 TaxID=3346949 RepID=UPI00364F194D